MMGQFYDGWKQEQIQGVIDFSDKFKNKTQSMLSLLSNNLEMMKNHMKKQKIKNTYIQQSSGLLKKRRNKKHKQWYDKRPYNLLDKQNNAHILNSQTKYKRSTSVKIRRQQKCDDTVQVQLQDKKQEEQSQNQHINISRLQKMFEVLKQCQSLNSTILPCKLNLSKIRNKKMLASIAFKDYLQRNSECKKRMEQLNQAQQRQGGLFYKETNGMQTQLRVKRVEQKRKKNENELKEQYKEPFQYKNEQRIKHQTLDQRKTTKTKRIQSLQQKQHKRYKSNRSILKSYSQKVPTLYPPFDYFSDSRFFLKRSPLQQLTNINLHTQN